MTVDDTRARVQIATVFLVMLAILLSVAACDATTDQTPAAAEEELLSGNLLTLSSPAFADGESIPEEYTCDGADVAPPLTWSDVPTDVQSYALIMDDPDATAGTWVHWVVYNIPADLKEMPQNTTDVGIQGANSWNETGYGGPCPPGGEHHYEFKLYALDTMLELSEGVDKENLLEAMEGHVLAQGELTGVYSR